MKKIYPGDKKDAIEVFQLCEAQGECFDISNPSNIVRDIFNRLGKNRGCSSSSSGIRTTEFPQVLGCGNLEKCSKQALLQRSVVAEKGFLAL